MFAKDFRTWCDTIALTTVLTQALELAAASVKMRFFVREFAPNNFKHFTTTDNIPLAFSALRVDLVWRK